MKNNNEIYFWSDMLIVQELSYPAINTALGAVLNDNYFNQAFTKIGLIKDVYSNRGWTDDSDVLKYCEE